MEEIRIISPTAILGYGFPRDSFQRGLEKDPHIIAVDAGSVDPGPYYLGAGVSFTDKASVKRDLKMMLLAGRERKIPVIVGSAGGAGADRHLKWCEDIVREIQQEEKLSFTLATIHSEIDKETLFEAFHQDKISPLAPAPALTEDQIAQSTSIVGQMGMEPFMDALQKGADVIIAGRAYDPTVFSAYCVIKGFPVGLAMHLGKILECASIACEPGSGSDSMFGTLRKDHFVVEPLNPERKCTVTSVAAHTLYEKEDPYKLQGPGGYIDLTQANFTQLDESKVKISGSRFVEDKPYKIKLEGARLVGYRTISIAGVRDPIMISELDNIIEKVKQVVSENFADLPINDYQLFFKLYGRDGVMGDLEPVKDIHSHEIGIIIEAVAKTQDLASTICSFARSNMLHFGYSGRVATAGNLAFPYSPSDFKAGEVYEFSLHHLIEVADPAKLFPVHIEQIGGDING